jgi:hypothetical protein
VSNRKKPLSKEDLLRLSKERLASDPNERERVLSRIVLVQQDAHGFLNEARDEGFDLESIQDLYHKRFDYKRLVPLILKWLPKFKHPANKEMAVRALTVKWAKQAAPALIMEFKKTDNSQLAYKWAIGSALEVVADDDFIDDLLGLANAEQHGASRQMIVRGLRKSKDPRVINTLIHLLDDKDVFGHAIFALGVLKAKEAEPHLIKFLQHKNTIIRKEAEAALAKIRRT